MVVWCHVAYIHRRESGHGSTPLRSRTLRTAEPSEAVATLPLSLTLGSLDFIEREYGF